MSEGDIIIPNVNTPKNQILTRAMTFINDDDCPPLGKEIIKELSTLMDMSNGHDEGREDTLKQSHKGFWEHEILQLIRNITDGDFDFKMVCNEVDKMVDFHGQLFIVRKYDDQEIKSLREQLAKEQKLRKELVEKLVAVIDEYATMDIVKIKHDYPYYEDEYKYIRTLIQEAKGT